MSNNTHHKRGFWLSLVLILMALHGIAGAIFYYAYSQSAVLDKPVLLGLMILHWVANVVAVIGIWFWKRWAMYVYAASTVLAIVVGLLATGMWSVFYFFLPLAILGYMLRTKWDYFE